MDEQDALTPLDPAYVNVLRIMSAIFGVFPFIGAIVLETVHVAPPGVFIGPLVALLVWWVWMVPQRRYDRWGYDAGVDRLRIERGYLFYHDTVVPFGRIQHIDVDQGPIERRYDLATLSVHTAGSHNSTVTLPGLKHSDALGLRERIREHIRKAQK